MFPAIRLTPLEKVRLSVWFMVFLTVASSALTLLLSIRAAEIDLESTGALSRYVKTLGDIVSQAAKDQAVLRERVEDLEQESLEKGPPSYAFCFHGIPGLPNMVVPMARIHEAQSVEAPWDCSQGEELGPSSP